MRDLGEIVAEALQAGEAREALFSNNARNIGQAVGTLLEALSERRAVHLVGEARCGHLAAYLAELLFAGGGQRALPARRLEGAPTPEGLARALEAHATEGDVLWLLALDDTPRVGHALSRARELGVRSIGLLAPAASTTLTCDVEIVVNHSSAPRAAESFLAVAHAVWELVLGGLTQLQRGDEPPPPVVQPDPDLVPRFRNQPERRRSARVTVRDAYARWRRDRFPEEDEHNEPHLLEDLSLTGLRFRGSRAGHLEVGDELYVCVDLPLYREPVRLRAQVRRVVKRKEPGGLTYAAGARVIEWCDDAQQRVRRVVDDPSLRSLRRRS